MAHPQGLFTSILCLSGRTTAPRSCLPNTLTCRAIFMPKFIVLRNSLESSHHFFYLLHLPKVKAVQRPLGSSRDSPAKSPGRKQESHPVCTGTSLTDVSLMPPRRGHSGRWERVGSHCPVPAATAVWVGLVLPPELTTGEGQDACPWG